ncbi:toll/interleukin-1 receptor domain-containing protein [Desulfobacterales bacterium HSG16]|nr:toll/interleukin-1 receptor domain-containing protein [Desulfobacterales bacterium HSG16]
MDDKDWKTLIHTIEQRECILMLGPDASVEQVNGDCRPLIEILAQDLSKKIKPDTRKKIDTSSIAQVSKYYCLETGKSDLLANVSSFYNAKNHTSELHKDLATLPFYFTVSASPDNMFATALKERGKEPAIERYNFRGENPDLVKMGTPETPLIFHLYGSTKEPRSLPLTEEDLLDFLVAVISKNPPLPHNILNELSAGNKSLLFIGFGFRHWYLRILLHVLHGTKKDSRSFAMEQFMPDGTECQNTILFFRTSDYKIHIFCNELSTFVKELKQRYLDSSPDPALKTLMIDAPTVFICHAKEDKDKAASLYEKFKNENIKPWFDEKNFRGGDAWDSVIKSTINEIDYFLLLQSHSLLNKKTGYVFREIKFAFKRQDEINPNSKHFFVIPAIIDDCLGLENLSDLHNIDLTKDTAFQKLVKDIKKDYQRLKRDKV